MIILMAAALVILTIVVGMLALRLFHKNDELKEKNDVIVRELRRNQQLIDRAVQNGVNRAAMLTVVVLLMMAGMAHAQTKFCTSFADYKADKWKPYEELIPGKEPDSIRVKYDGQDFTLKTSDKEVNKVIKHDVFMMQIDKQLFINQRPLRDEDGGILPVNNFLRALPYKGDKLCVVSYKVTLGDVLDLVNIGLDVALLATGHTTWGTIFLATDLLLTNDDLMEHHVLYVVDKEPDQKGRYIMTRINDKYMEQLLRDDPVTFEQYYGRGKKGDRQSAANILPILVKKGLISDYHHKKN